MMKFMLQHIVCSVIDVTLSDGRNHLRLLKTPSVWYGMYQAECLELSYGAWLLLTETLEPLIHLVECVHYRLSCTVAMRFMGQNDQLARGTMTFQCCIETLTLHGKCACIPV